MNEENVYRIQRIDEKRVWLASSIAVVLGHVLLIAMISWVNATPIPPVSPKRLRVHMSSQYAPNATPSVKETISTSKPASPQTAVKTPVTVAKAPAQKTKDVKTATPANVLPAVSSPISPAAATAPAAVKSKVPAVKQATAPTVKATPAKVTTPPTSSTANAASQKQQAKITAQAQAKQRLLAQVQQTLADAQSTHANQAVAATADSMTLNNSDTASWSSPIELPSASASAYGKANHYDEILSLHLRQTVVLPEHGTVDVSLTLDREGHIIHCVIIEAASVRNRTYVNSTLPQLQLPAWPAYLGDAKEYTVRCKLTTHL